MADNAMNMKSGPGDGVPGALHHHRAGDLHQHRAGAELFTTTVPGIFKIRCSWHPFPAALRDLEPADARRAFVEDAKAELATASTAHVQHDIAAAADLVARVAGTLDSIVTGGSPCV